MENNFQDHLLKLVQMMTVHSTEHQNQSPFLNKDIENESLSLEIKVLEPVINRCIERQFEKLKCEIFEKISKLKNVNIPRSKHLTLKQAAEFTGLSESYIYKLVSRQEIPHFKRGKRNIFEQESLEKWLLAHRVKTMEEIQEEANERINNRRGSNGW